MSQNDILAKARRGNLEFAELFWSSYMARYHWQTWSKKSEITEFFFRSPSLYKDCIKTAKKNIEIFSYVA